MRYVKNSVVDPDLGSGAFWPLDPGSGMGKKNQDPDQGWTTRIIYPRAEKQFFGLKSKKIYRLKDDQAFSLSLELGRREKVAWRPSVGGGGDFVDRYCYCGENDLERDES